MQHGHVLCAVLPFYVDDEGTRIRVHITKSQAVDGIGDQYHAECLGKSDRNERGGHHGHRENQHSRLFDAAFQQKDRQQRRNRAQQRKVL
ncbi:hypothetical protein SDC9_205393 [bioreactor metagenome]|uniref:Uncharacterized protein n=1 Tax=bioreactor metagenome TaxID=1076179 RepID=A0A645J4T1_9ZZZZ